MNVAIPLSHWICSLILLIFTKILLEVYQQEAWITLTFFFSTVCLLYWGFYGPNQWWKKSSRHQSHLKPFQGVANAHFSFFSLETGETETLKCQGTLFLTFFFFFCYFSKWLFGFFLWDHLGLVCTSSNSAESTFCLSYMIICLFIVGNPLENSVIFTPLEQGGCGERNEGVRGEENAGKSSCSHACGATVQALTGKLWCSSRTEDTAAFSYIMILRLLASFSQIFCFLI